MLKSRDGGKPNAGTGYKVQVAGTVRRTGVGVDDGATFEAAVRSLLSEGYRICFEARGRSMRPWIRAGDELVVAPVDLDRLRAGDVVLHARTSGGPVAHRIMGRRRRDGRRIWLTRGDAAAAECDIVTEDQILGRVAGVQRGGRRVQAGCGPVGRWVALARAKARRGIRLLRISGSRIKRSMRSDR